MGEKTELKALRAAWKRYANDEVDGPNEVVEATARYLDSLSPTDRPTPQDQGSLPDGWRPDIDVAALDDGRIYLLHFGAGKPFKLAAWDGWIGAFETGEQPLAWLDIPPWLPALSSVHAEKE